jgi:glycosyltransferase involved in cell wall biosynthesis
MSASRRLRVLMVDSERSWRGGQAQVLLLMRGLVEAGVDVHLAAPGDGALFARAGEPGVTRRALPAHAPPAAAVLRGMMRRGGFDVVHSHASRAHGWVALARLGLRRRPPHVVSRRVDFAVGRGAVGALKYRRGADAYIAISRGVRDVLVAGGIPAERIHLAPSGIDLAKFERLREPSYLREEFGVTPRERIVGSVAALAPHKSHRDLLHAAARVRARRDDVRFFLVGEGELRTGLERLAEELGIREAVVFTGFRPDALELMSIFDVFVMSSYLEGLGTSIMDAHALRVPVVATRAGGIPEIVEDGVTGLLVPPRAPDLLAEAILRMLDDGALREACAREAQLRSTGYDYHAMVHKTLDVYRRLCDVHVPPGRERVA